MSEQALRLEFTLRDTVLDGNIGNLYLLKPYVRIEVFDPILNAFIDVTASISQFLLSLQKDAVSSCVFNVPVLSAGDFVIDSKIKIFLGYNIQGVVHSFLAYQGKIKRKTFSHESLLNTIKIQTFGNSYLLREKTGTQLISERVEVCAVSVSVDPSTFNPNNDPGLVLIPFFEDRLVPKRWIGNAEDLLREFLDNINIVYVLGRYFDYRIDVQLNFSTVLELMQHVLSFAPVTPNWWDGPNALHIKARSTEGVKEASSVSPAIPGVQIINVSASTEAGTGTLFYSAKALIVESGGQTLFRGHVCTPTLQWTAPNETVAGAPVEIDLDSTFATLFSRKQNSFIQVAVSYNNLTLFDMTSSVTIIASPTPRPEDIVLTGNQFTIAQREASVEVEKKVNTIRFITPYQPYINLASWVRLTDPNIGVDRTILIDSISINFAFNSTRLEMECKGEIVKQ